MRAMALSLALAVLASSPSWADDAATVDRWYVALRKADGGTLGELLMPDAIVKLNDIGLTQNKAEFVASMGEWKAAIAGGSIRYKADDAIAVGLAYKVCYDFPANELLTREVFSFENGLISRSEQTSLAENCDWRIAP